MTFRFFFKLFSRLGTEKVLHGLATILTIAFDGIHHDVLR